MNIDHPYGYTICFALVCAGLFFLTQAAIALEELRAKRARRRLDRLTDREISKQFWQIASRSNSGPERP